MKNMMKKRLLATILLIMSGGAMAAESKSVINVSGQITADSCAIYGSDNMNPTANVALPDVDTQALSAGIYQYQQFKFNLACTANHPVLTATFSANAADSDVPGYGSKSVIANTGSARNVGIGLIGATSVTETGGPTGYLPLGVESAGSPSLNNPIISTTHRFIFGAQIVPLKKDEPVMPGTVSGTATFVLNYT